MADKFSEAEMNKALFTNLVMMFSATAMQQLGKLVNPATAKAEVDLRGAQVSVDILSMLAAKTRGNLDREEERLLSESISSVQMNYVETAASMSKVSDKTADVKKDKQQVADIPDTANEAADVKPAECEAEKKSPKFHKAYGEG
ncbi:MAG: DUF1844 domain-containing protein [bacterium]